MNPGNICELKKIIQKISGFIPPEHLGYTFWCPKDMDGDIQRQGYILYAYGGWILKLYNFAGKTYLEMFDKKYEKYMDRSCSERIRAELSQKYKGKKAGNSDTILSYLEEFGYEGWRAILDAFAERAYNFSEQGEKTYLERARETRIAHINDGSCKNGMKIIEMESRIPEAGKKPDLIGVREEAGETIFSYIEYKCTESAMNGNSKPVEHFRDMQRYYKKNFTYFESYDRRREKPVLRDIASAKKEILFLFSHVGQINNKYGMTFQKAINGIKRIADVAGADKDAVRIVILENENTVIRQSGIMTIERALEELEARKKG